MKHSNFTPLLRLCSPDDLDAIMTLQETVCSALEQKELFVPTSREENAGYLIQPNVVFGVFDQEKMIAYASLVFPGTAADNLGWDLGWDSDTVSCCGRLDTIVVDPAYRGCGLQRTLIARCLSHAEDAHPGCILLTTVSPENIYSLRNVQKEGFQILKRMQKYGGYDRYILGHAANTLLPEVF